VIQEIFRRLLDPARGVLRSGKRTPGRSAKRRFGETTNRAPPHVNRGDKAMPSTTIKSFANYSGTQITFSNL
jgi:hypothetical protein